MNQLSKKDLIIINILDVICRIFEGMSIVIMGSIIAIIIGFIAITNFWIFIVMLFIIVFYIIGACFADYYR